MVPKHRCSINECENISTATYYDQPILPSGNWTDDELAYSDFVKLAIGQINENEYIAEKQCNRIQLHEPVLPSSIVSTKIEDTCSILKAELTLPNG